MVNYFDTIDRLQRYSIQKFSDPVEGWAPEKVKIRSYEQSFSEIIILDCYDEMFNDPRDVIFGKLMYYDYIIGRLENDSIMMESYKCAVKTCNILLSYLETI